MIISKQELNLHIRRIKRAEVKMSLLKTSRDYYNSQIEELNIEVDELNEITGLLKSFKRLQ
tara:strand:- start:3070 stop:3252 length:183 start_codon:yes stop_codon:yes gene_type:complete